MDLSRVLAPLLDVPGTKAAAFLDPQGQTIAHAGDLDAIEVAGAYGSVWMSDLRRAAEQGALGPLSEIAFDFEKGRLVARMVARGHFVLLVFDRDGLPSLATPVLDRILPVLAAELY